MKNRLFVICVLTGLITLLSACGTTSGNPNVDIAEDSVNTNIDAETENLTYSLPEVNMGGYVFRMYNAEGNISYLLDVDEQDGDLINDAIYTRNSIIEEYYNMEFENISYGSINGLWGEVTTKIQADILAGSTDYEVMRMRIPNSVTFFTQGYIYPYDDLPYLNLDMPWWNQGVKESLTIDGHVLYTYGDYNLSSYDSTNLLIFNKQMIDDFELDSPYDLVDSGDWTLDTMTEMMETVTNDINGDGLYDVNDRWGMYSEVLGIYISFYMSAGERFIEKDSDDIPHFRTTNNERLINVIGTIMELVWDNNIVFCSEISKYTNTNNTNIFQNGNALFHSMQAGQLNGARDWDVEFGIVPYPKYDKNQERYYIRHEGCYPIMVPITNENIDYTSMILEAMAYYSREYVIPAYYDLSLKTKGTRDNESEEMLDIIFESRIVDMGDIFFTDTVRAPYNTMFASGINTYVSTTESMKSAADDNINKTIEAFIDHFN